MEVKKMKKAYGMLYEVENSLRFVINDKMTHSYGIGWIIAAPIKNKRRVYSKRLSQFNLHELISMLSTYDPLSKLFTPLQLVKLQQITPIRNKIAHCKELTKDEFEKLSNAFGIVRQINIDDKYIKEEV